MAGSQAHKIEQGLLSLLAAIPLLFTFVLSPLSVLVFIAIMGLLLAGIAMGRPVTIPPPLLAATGVVYLLFFPFDVLVLTRGLVAPCSHLLFFIAIYQTIESEWRENQAQRLLVAFLIFVTAAATSTHWAIIFWILAFGFLVYREMMRISWLTSVAEIPGAPPIAPRSRLAAVLGLATVILAVSMFPLLPRVRDPYVRGLPSLSATQSTGISDEIDFRDERIGSDDPEVVARVWPEAGAEPFLPVRLRASVYDAWIDEKWVSARRRIELISGSRADREWRLGRAAGVRGQFRVQQRRSHDQRIFVPTGTYRIEGLWQAHGTRYPGVVATDELRQRPIDYTAHVSEEVDFFANERAPVPLRYPVAPEIRSLALRITGGTSDPVAASRAIERFLLTQFEYVADISEQGEPITVERFLLEERRGHCEYFAAGMVVLLTAVDIPARIVGGFYGGEENAFSGYYLLRKSDAHAWVEVWNGMRWQTFDPTPPDLRPGAGASSLFRQLFASIDSISYAWDRWILTYGASDQISLSERAMDQARAISQAIGGNSVAIKRLVTGLVVACGLVWLLIQFGGFRSRGDYYGEMIRILIREGFELAPSMTSGDISRRIGRQRRDLVETLAPILSYHERTLFSPRPAGERIEQEAREALRNLKERLRSG